MIANMIDLHLDYFNVGKKVFGKKRFGKVKVRVKVGGSKRCRSLGKARFTLSKHRILPEVLLVDFDPFERISGYKID